MTQRSKIAAVALPFHSGAIRYFKEKGTWTDAHERKPTSRP